ncbi:hydrophobin [Trichoderma gamsii]|uniref:Hydrophobin n=1 Tax=Trichoderma gamsii TaxID=398673 RepID=A0A2P5A2X9_9HYPO|nr:hydrophobin [Trichoderma gamsii]PON30897.1 hydrophobin [Trichoderma gamsii]
MQFSVVALFATGALAAVCPTGIFSNPLCCSIDVLGVVGLDCSFPNNGILDGPSFQAACDSEGKQPLCCVAPAAEEGILCQKPVETI